MNDKVITRESIKAMSNDEFLSQLPDDVKAYFGMHPEMLSAFKAFSEGDKDRSKFLTDEALGGNYTPEKALEHIEHLTAVRLSIVPDVLKKIMESVKPEMSPEEEAEMEQFQKNGVDIHLSLEMFNTLLDIMEDGHEFVVRMLELGKKLGDKISPEQEEGLNAGFDRHTNHHSFERYLFKQVEKTYPLVGKADEERQSQNEVEPTRH